MAEARSVADLVRDALDGRLRIPAFQRRFRWDGRDIERLFDSIWRGYPAGSLLLWERAAAAARLQLGPVVIDAPEVRDALWVIDGQQRLTSLVGVLAAPPEVKGAFELYFDLITRDFRRAGARHPPASWLPLRKVIETNVLLTWLLDFRDRGGSQEQVDAATALGDRVREYKLPVSIVRTDDESILRDVFDRMNNFGRRLTRAEVFHALHASLGDDNPQDLNHLADDVAVMGFGPLREDTVLRAVLAVRGGDVFRDFHNEFGPGEDPAAAYAETAQALRRTIGFLQSDVRIPHVRALPYVLVLPVLARFFSLHGEPSERTRILLRRWVWRGAIAGLGGGGGATAAQRRAVQDVDEDEDASAQRLLAGVDPRPSVALPLDAVQLNRAAGRVNLSLLASLGPRELTTGETLDATALFDDHDGGGLLRVPSESGRVESLASVFVHPTLPDDQVSAALTEATEEVLRSHGLDAGLVEPLRNGHVDAFLTARREALDGRLSRELALLAEPGASDRPPIASLVVPDDG
jgi:hypothetical protein